MKARVVFVEGSKYGEEEYFDGVKEVHYNYPSPLRQLGQSRLAIECGDTGYTYPVDEILEIKVWDE